jgi:hypothetical protein
MPTYFFELRNHHGVVRDPNGQTFPDVAAARKQAVDTVRSIISDEVKRGSIDLRGRIQVSDARGLVLTLPFAEAVEVRTGVPSQGFDQPGIDHD